MIHIILILMVLVISIFSLVWWKKNSPEDLKFYAVYVSIIFVLYLSVQVLCIIGTE